ncbi:serine hydrolase domain-containing protein [Candidatus Leptofilum sp.]|uniref:serine hydrolase domain-containing protein n=1 Tax=Candidatus Leptofilum sp. TaxID=3241576 RepID=UPI003B5B497D
MRKRKKFLRFLGIAVLILLVSGGVWRWQSAPPRKPDSIPLDDYSYTIAYAEYRIERLMKQYHLPSTAVSLIDDQTIIWQEAFGLANIAGEIPATPDTLYKMYSIAKVFTAIEMMRLVEEGLVDLDAPITDYLPEFSIHSRFPDNHPITVRAILAHHAGLPRNGCTAVTWYGGDVMEELAASLANCQMTFPVGVHYKYSNIGSNVLGAIIQNVRGKPFPYYMEDELLMPVGMQNSAFLTADLPAQNNEIAVGYEYVEGDYYPIEQGDHVMLASGNMYATLADMTTFAQFILGDGTANGTQIIKPETLHQMGEDQYSRPQDPQPMGLGWKTAQVFGAERLIWHDGGASEGVGSLIALLPERKLGVVLLANENSFEGSVSVFLALDLLAQMMEAKYGLIPSEYVAPEPIDIDLPLLAAYEGKYVAWGQALPVSLNGDRLQLDFQGIKLNLIPVSQTKFQVEHWLLRLPLEEYFLLPVELGPLREMEVEFQPGDESSDDIMILNFSGVAYEICPKYPEITNIPALWQALAGEYELFRRLPSGGVGSEVFGHDAIRIEDGILRMPGVIGPIIPISETEIVILSGSFAGELMEYDPDSGALYHQWVVYKPAES